MFSDVDLLLYLLNEQPRVSPYRAAQLDEWIREVSARLTKERPGRLVRMLTHDVGAAGQTWHSN